MPRIAPGDWLPRFLLLGILVVVIVTLALAAWQTADPAGYERANNPQAQPAQVVNDGLR